MYIYIYIFCFIRVFCFCYSSLYIIEYHFLSSSFLITFFFSNLIEKFNKPFQQMKLFICLTKKKEKKCFYIIYINYLIKFNSTYLINYSNFAKISPTFFIILNHIFLKWLYLKRMEKMSDIASHDAVNWNF